MGAYLSGKSERMPVKGWYKRERNTMTAIESTVIPPNTAPSLTASPSIPEYIFSWLYPFIAVFLYRHSFASPKSGGIVIHLYGGSVTGFYF